ncbi:hypothetical protein A2164_03095 [Candidatus Curtissbacteria bacterium RBG_13_35_7]|uniref:LytR/CpsA/Psr regulator C-terminal domain-containing protein n=1 Tax=Candidatus Curtissbacteria bacterium RBG_13_35_7 TaxID=1797705 RepID=A0A1F5G1B9_9BACT|nr:MAG: hypothetical protein A2164_03095 [Candidatus Curtissbacteria bacterium RBG_13_35_7]
MLFSKSIAIFYLRRNSLEVYAKQNEPAAQLNFPPNYEKDEEIIDQGKIEQLIANFLSKLNLNGYKIIIAVSNELLFEKTIPRSDSKKEDQETNKFFAEIPFDPQKIVKKEIKTQNGINLIATNKNLYEAIVHVIQKLTLEIEAVVPITAFGITSTATLTKQDLSKITSNQNMQKISNFLEENVPKIATTAKEPISAETGTETKPKQTKLLILGIVLILIGAVLITILFFKPNLTNKFTLPIFVKKIVDQPILEEPEPTNLEESQATPSQEPAEISKADIKIHILNGTGTSGQANQVKIQLEKLSFTNIETGNAANKDFDETVIIYTTNIPQSIKDEIEAELANTFQKIEIAADEQNENYNIVITTGKPK